MPSIHLLGIAKTDLHIFDHSRQAHNLDLVAPKRTKETKESSETKKKETFIFSLSRSSFEPRQDFTRRMTAEALETVALDTKVYFGNLPFTLTDEALKAFAAPAGSILSAEVIRFRERSKGFGFVTYASKEEASKAIELLNDKDLEGRPANVKLSKPKVEGALAAQKPKRAPRKVCYFALPSALKEIIHLEFVSMESFSIYCGIFA
jgi:RNA recognition motif-containing protein